MVSRYLIFSLFKILSNLKCIHIFLTNAYYYCIYHTFLILWLQREIHIIKKNIIIFINIIKSSPWIYFLHKCFYLTWFSLCRWTGRHLHPGTVLSITCFITYSTLHHQHLEEISHSISLSHPLVTVPALPIPATFISLPPVTRQVHVCTSLVNTAVLLCNGPQTERSMPTVTLTCTYTPTNLQVMSPIGSGQLVHYSIKSRPMIKCKSVSYWSASCQ